MSPLTTLQNRRFMSQARQTRNFTRIFLLPSPRDSYPSCAKSLRNAALALLGSASYVGYLLYTKRAFPFSLALRIRRICYFNKTYKLCCNELTQYLNRRVYNVGFLNQEKQRVHTITTLTHTNPAMS